MVVGDLFLVWCLKWFYRIVENWEMVFNVLKIKFKTVKITKLFPNEPKGHLALRLNNAKEVFKGKDLLDLIEYVQMTFGVKYLTLICGTFGFERELDFRGKSDKLKVSLFHNYEPIHTTSNSTISINLIDNDSESLFLLKLKEFKEADYESIYRLAVNSFTSIFINIINLFIYLSISLSLYLSFSLSFFLSLSLSFRLPSDRLVPLHDEKF